MRALSCDFASHPLTVPPVSSSPKVPHALHAPAIVIPFAVPEDHEGLGIGVAALLMGLLGARGLKIGLAQMFIDPSEQTHRDGGSASAGKLPDFNSGKAQPMSALPVEAFIPYQVWKNISQRPEKGRMPVDSAEFAFVLTGSFEPPAQSSSGHFHIFAYDAKTGATVTDEQIVIDAHTAGASVADAFRRVIGSLETQTQDPGTEAHDPIPGLLGLDWEALESVIRAERCELHDPRKNTAHDRAAALVHLERAILDAPEALYPPERLAAIALSAVGGPETLRGLEAVLRTVKRALLDVPNHATLHDAALALEVRTFQTDAAFARVHLRDQANALTPLAYSLWSELHRSQKELGAARKVLELGMRAYPNHPVLCCEQGALSFEEQDWEGAKAAYRLALQMMGPESYAFFRLAELALHVGDVETASGLVDTVLFCPRSGLSESHLHMAIKLAMELEPDGIHRGSRVAKLGKHLIEWSPDDPRPHLLTSRALARIGERETALYHLDRVEELAPKSVWASEAALGRFHLEHPEEALELEALVRATSEVTLTDLPTIVIRAQRFALLHDAIWLTHFALGLAEARAKQWTSARRAFERAASASPGSVAVWREHAKALLELGECSEALVSVERALLLEPQGAALHALRAEVHHALHSPKEARSDAEQAQRLDPNNEAYKALLIRMKQVDLPTGLSPEAWLKLRLDSVRAGRAGHFWGLWKSNKDAS
jgi:tetratricopeptide (TPR) repeat protein